MSDLDRQVRERIDRLVEHFEFIHRERMQDLPFVNDAMAVEAVGFAPECDDTLGVLITPWFMNLLLLPGTDRYAVREQGTSADIDLPEGRYSFVITHDDDLGTYLTAVLFRTVADFPDQDTAREIAIEILERLRRPRDADAAEADASRRRISRRALLAGRA